MSHYTVTIVLPRPPLGDGDAQEMIAELIEPFDENTRVERYKSYVEPVNSEWRDMPTRELPWPYSYIKDNAPEVDLGDANAVATWLNAKWGPEEQHFVDEQGLYQWSTYNPQSKWDWWQLGGRWDGFYNLLNGNTTNCARKGDIDAEGKRVQTYAVLAEGVWKAPGNMGWFGMSTETDTEAMSFDVWFQEHFWNTMPDDAWLAVIDCHI